MDGEVPHAARADEVGDIAKALKAFQTDAIKWSEMHKSEQDSQVQLRLAAQQPTEELIHQFRGGRSVIRNRKGVADLTPAPKGTMQR